MREGQSQVPEVLVNRGVGWQAVGFILTGIICLTILKAYDGTDYWLYQWFETATVDLYWTTIVPLAFLFDWVRKMFESAKAIREAQKARMLDKERKRIKEELEKQGVTLSPDVVEAVFGSKSKDSE